MLTGKLAAAAALVLVLLGGLAPSAGADLGIPTEGWDFVELTDGRVLTCKYEEERGGESVNLTFPSGSVKVAKKRIAKTRLAKDYDSTPTTPEEEAKVKQGLVRWAGEWMAADKAKALRKAEVDAGEAIRKDDEAHSLWEKRRILETEHFLVEANIPKANLDYYLGLLEAYYEQLTKTLNVKLTARERKKKAPVYFYRHKEEYWKRYMEDNGGKKGEHTNGYFTPVPGREKLVLFDQRYAREETLDTLLHEATHYILHLAEPQVLVSRWVHEGCAEYFSAASYKDGKFTPGLVQDGRLLTFHLMAAKDRMIPMDTFMLTGNHGAPVGSEFDHWYYAQAWTMIHFFMHYQDGVYAPRFRAYLQKILSRQGLAYEAMPATARKFVRLEDDKALLLKMLKIKDFPELLKQLADYAKSLPMRKASAYVERGKMRHWIDKDPAGAKDDFEMAQESAGDDANALFQLALAFSNIENRYKEVFPLLRKALEVDPLNVWVRYEFAKIRSLPPEERLKHLRLCTDIEPERGAPAGDLAALLLHDQLGAPLKLESPDQIAVAQQARALAERATKNEPDHRHFDTLSTLCVALGDFPAAGAAAERAMQDDPENSAYLAQRAMTHALLGESDLFVKTLGRALLLLRRMNPDDKDGANQGEIRSWLAKSADACRTWEKTAEGTAAVKAWFTRHAPQNAEDWLTYAELLKRTPDRAAALDVAKQGKQAFPSSPELATLVDSLS